MEHLIIPVLGILSGIIIPIAVFTWLYHENKDKRKTVLEIAKHMDNPEKLDELMQIFEERKKEPIDYRRNGVITIFVGIGLYFFGFIWIGKVLEGIGFFGSGHRPGYFDCRIPLSQHGKRIDQRSRKI